MDDQMQGNKGSIITAERFNSLRMTNEQLKSQNDYTQRMLDGLKNIPTPAASKDKEEEYGQPDY